MYLCPIEYYPNCRGHDGGYYNGVEFFKTTEDLLYYALKQIDEYVILDIYDSSGRKVGKVEYEISSHRCSGIKITIDDKKYRTIDNGKGNLIWSREN